MISDPRAQRLMKAYFIPRSSHDREARTLTMWSSIQKHLVTSKSVLITLNHEDCGSNDILINLIHGPLDQEYDKGLQLSHTGGQFTLLWHTTIDSKYKYSSHDKSSYDPSKTPSNPRSRINKILSLICPISLTNAF